MRDLICDGTRPAGLVPFLYALLRHLAGIATILTGLSASVQAATSSPESGPRTVLLVTLDGARADLPFRPAEAPALAGLAREGLTLTRATTPTALTFPATVSLMTGLYPHHSGVQDELRAPLGSSTETLAQSLTAAGWSTAGFPGDYLCHAESGVHRGFGTYLLGAPELTDSARVDTVLAFLRDHAQERCFVWVGFAFAGERPVWERYVGMEAPDSAAYLGRLRELDSQIGRLLAGVDLLGLRPEALVSVLGTHGEVVPGWRLPDSPAEENPIPGHGLDLSEEALRVPWVIRMPDSSGESADDRTTTDEWVSTVDLAPTILDLVGSKAPRRSDGVSLAAHLRGEPLPRRVLFHEADLSRTLGWGPRLAARGSESKLLRYGERTALVRLGDGSAEPDRTEPADLATALREEFRVPAPGMPDPAAQDTLFAREDQQILQLLELRRTASREVPDALTRLTVLQLRHPRNLAILAELTLRKIYGRREVESAQYLNAILVQEPDLLEVEALYAEQLLFFSRHDILVGRLAKITGYPMFEADRLWRLGAAQLAEGRAAEAEETYARAARVGAPPGRRWRSFQEQLPLIAALRLEIQDFPGRGEPYIRLGDALWNLGLFDDGYMFLQQGRGRTPRDPLADYKLGHYLALEGRPKHAAASFERALVKDPAHVPARVELAFAKLEMGEDQEALRHLKEAVATGQAGAQAEYNLACLLARTGDAQAALDALETAMQHGYANRSNLESDPDLDSIRGDPRFRKILAGLP